MSYNVLAISLFDRQLKRLAKKYPSLKNDLSKLSKSLSLNPQQGTVLGKNFYKIRLAISSKAQGKSGGARVITYIRVVNKSVFLTSIYDKSEKANITSSELEKIIKLIPEN